MVYNCKSHAVPRDGITDRSSYDVSETLRAWSYYYPWEEFGFGVYNNTLCKCKEVSTPHFFTVYQVDNPYLAKQYLEALLGELD